jgi:hypothetical protein
MRAGNIVISAVDESAFAGALVNKMLKRTAFILKQVLFMFSIGMSDTGVDHARTYSLFLYLLR